jgi:ubiquinone/menaquinone biosynthesis C-methylase UbiE
MMTGTGLVAIEAAQLVGVEGWVVGVDISPGMLEQANRKVLAAGLSNIEWKLANVETVELPENSFDVVLCCAALPYLTNIPAALGRWYRFVKPGGLMGVTGVSETSEIYAIVLRRVALRYGVELPSWNQETGTKEKCYALLREVGFEDIEVKTEQFGSYFSLNEALRIWETILGNPLCRPMLQLNSEQLEQTKADYCAELEALLTDKGIWNEITNFFILGRKKEGI